MYAVAHLLLELGHPLRREDAAQLPGADSSHVACQGHHGHLRRISSSGMWRKTSVPPEGQGAAAVALASSRKLARPRRRVLTWSRGHRSRTGTSALSLTRTTLVGQGAKAGR